MTKYIVMAFIIGFWLVLPIPFLLIGSNEFNTMNLSSLDSLNSPQPLNFFDYVNITLQYLGIYFQILFLGIPQANWIINFFLLFLKGISALIIIMLLKGE